jgi:DNA-binding transcriptional ArsR family regulator
VTTQLVDEPSLEEFLAAVESLKLLADLTRLRIIWALLHGEHAVNELAEHVGMNKTAVSQHLAKLRMAHLVTTRRDGNKIYYSAGDHHIGRLVQEALFHSDHLTDDQHDDRRQPRRSGESA